jgi:hypothetical protein
MKPTAENLGKTFCSMLGNSAILYEAIFILEKFAFILHCVSAESREN